MEKCTDLRCFRVRFFNKIFIGWFFVVTKQKKPDIKHNFPFDLRGRVYRA